MIDALKMANIENTDKYAKLAPLPLAGVGGGFCRPPPAPSQGGHHPEQRDCKTAKLQNCITSFVKKS